MPVNLIVPEAGESISEVRIGAWHKAEGEFVNVEEVVVEIETDKAAIELPAPVSGTLVSIVMPEGEEAAIGDVIGVIDEKGKAPPADSRPSASKSTVKAMKTEAAAPAAAGSKPESRVTPSDESVPDESGVAAPVAEAKAPGPTVVREDAAPAVETTQAKPARS